MHVDYPSIATTAITTPSSAQIRCLGYQIRFLRGVIINNYLDSHFTSILRLYYTLLSYICTKFLSKTLSHIIYYYENNKV